MSVQKPERLLQGLEQVHAVQTDPRRWENESEQAFSLFRRGCLDAAADPRVLDEPLYATAQMAAAWSFLLDIGKRPLKRKHVLECINALILSDNWLLVLRGDASLQPKFVDAPPAMQTVLRGALERPLKERKSPARKAAPPKPTEPVFPVVCPPPVAANPTAKANAVAAKGSEPIAPRRWHSSNPFADGGGRAPASRASLPTSLSSSSNPFHPANPFKDIARHPEATTKAPKSPKASEALQSVSNLPLPWENTPPSTAAESRSGMVDDVAPDFWNLSSGTGLQKGTHLNPLQTVVTPVSNRPRPVVEEVAREGPASFQAGFGKIAHARHAVSAGGQAGSFDFIRPNF